MCPFWLEKQRLDKRPHLQLLHEFIHGFKLGIITSTTGGGWHYSCAIPLGKKPTIAYFLLVHLFRTQPVGLRRSLREIPMESENPIKVNSKGMKSLMHVSVAS